MRTSNSCPQIRFCALNCDLQIRFCALNCDLQIRFCALNCDLQIRFCALNCDLQIRFCALNCDLQIRCTIPILSSNSECCFFLSFALQTSNCCLQIRFCALNCDVQISVFKLWCVNSVFQIPFSRSSTQSLTWAIVGLVTEFSARKRQRDQHGRWKVFRSC